MNNVLIRFLRIIIHLNINTLVFNFKLLKLRDAIVLPFYVSTNVKIINLSGRVRINSKVYSGMVRIGYGDVGIFDKQYSRTIIEIKGLLTFEREAFIGHGSKISIGKNGLLVFGNNFRISAESSIIANKHVVFGNNCLLSWEIQILDTDFHKIYNENGERINEDEPIIFGDNVWIGCKCLILKGSRIPNNAIIAANSTISNVLVGDKMIFGANPIRILKSNVTWNY